MTNLLEKIGRVLWGDGDTPCCDATAPALRLAVKCAKCGEIITTRIEKAYELEAEYDLCHGRQAEEEDDEAREPRPSGFVLHKEMIGANCQNLIQVEMHLDAQRGMISRSVEGGELVEFVDCE